MTNVTLYPHWREALRVLLDEGLTYGHTVSRKRIAELCGLKEPKTIPEKEQYDLLMLGYVGGIKEELLVLHKMFLLTNRDGTYRVVMPAEQTTCAVERGIHAIARELQTMAQVVQYTETSLLSNDERKKNTDAQAKIAALDVMANKGRKDLMKLVK